MAMVKCSECGRDVSDRAASCPGCGAPIGATAPVEPAPTSARPVASRAESTLYDHGGVKVTTARVVFPGRTYATANITSVAVRASTIVPPKGGPSFLIFFGLVLLIVGVSSSLSMAGLIGLISLLAGVAWVTTLKTTHEYRVFLGSAGGEAEALVSRDQGYIQQIADALNTAIVQRG